jgi:hypothetical protein
VQHPANIRSSDKKHPNISPPLVHARVYQVFENSHERGCDVTSAQNFEHKAKQTAGSQTNQKIDHSNGARVVVGGGVMAVKEVRVGGGREPERERGGEGQQAQP